MTMREKRHSRNESSRGTALLLAVCCALLGIFLFLLYRSESGPDEAETSTSVDEEVIVVDGVEYVPKKNIKSYLFIGTDDKVEEGEGYVTGGQCDVLQVLVVDRSHRRYRRLSINRNTMMDVHSYDEDGEDLGTTYCQIALAHSSGDGGITSCQYTIEAVSEYLHGVQFDYYARVGLNSLRDINHLLGGVSVTIEDDFSRSDPTLVQGETVLLSDEQAYHFLHDRTNVGDGSNEGRMRRQEAYLNSARGRVMELLKTDKNFPKTAFQTLNEIALTNMNEKEFGRLLNVASSYEAEENVEITGTIGEDEFAFATFESDPESVQDAVLALFYERKDQ